MEQSYHLTLEKAIADYKKGYISTLGLVRYYINIKFAPGWKISLDPKKVCMELKIGIHKFYRAIAKLKNELPIAFVRQTRLVGEMPDNDNFAIRETEVVNDAKFVAPRAKVVATSAKTVTQDAKNDPETANKNSTSKDLPDYIHSSFHSFFQSLSQEERENFLSFVREKTANYKNPINDLADWLAGKNKASEFRFAVYYNLFQDKDKQPELTFEVKSQHAQKLKEFGYIYNWKTEGSEIFIATEYAGRVDWHTFESFSTHNPGYAIKN